MQIRTFRASSVERAWECARRELGSGLELVTTRSSREGGFLGLGGRRVIEITVAAKEPELPVGRTVVPRSRESISARADRPRVVDLEIGASGRGAWSGQVPVAASPASPAAPTSRLPDERTSLLGAIARTEAGRVATASPLSDIEGAVAAVLEQGEPSAGAEAGRFELPGRFLEVYATLLEQELDRSLADRAVAEARQELAPACWHDLKAVREAVASALERMLPAATASTPARAGARTLSLIGPTGVGKTTTLAKLAALLKLRLNLRVGLITCDTYRIAAVEQLRTYAEIIGLPLLVVEDPQQMREAKQRFADLDAVLVDTAGRSQNDRQRIEELQAFVEAAEPDEVHLVLSAVASDRVLRREAAAFTRVRTDRLLFSKLDEAVTFGPLFSLAVRLARPISYLTTGQEVPEHLEPATPARVAEILLGGAVRS